MFSQVRAVCVKPMYSCQPAFIGGLLWYKCMALVIGRTSVLIVPILSLGYRGYKNHPVIMPPYRSTEFLCLSPSALSPLLLSTVFGLLTAMTSTSQAHGHIPSNEPYVVVNISQTEVEPEVYQLPYPPELTLK
jgi:hypothetical protein